MGLFKFLARKGNIGGTARIIGKQYKRYKLMYSNDSNVTNKDIYEQIIKDRFKILKNKSDEKLLLSNLFLISGVKELVIEILAVELGFYKIPYKQQNLYRDIIEEELLKLGIDKSEL